MDSVQQIYATNKKKEYLVLRPVNEVMLEIKLSEQRSLLASCRIERENSILVRDLNPGL